MLRNLLIAAALTLGFAGASVLAQAAPPTFAQHLIRVEYRAPNWQQRTFDTWHEAQRFAETKRHQGFEVDIDRHGHHFHVRFRCCHWQVYQTLSCPIEARQLERQLEQRGYEARVVHVR